MTDPPKTADELFLEYLEAALARADRKTSLSPPTGDPPDIEPEPTTPTPTGDPATSRPLSAADAFAACLDRLLTH
ncbi:MAG: hypothetical protein LBS56_10345 [Propionibacteriaceae bacterium]|jgi:hypothetical protein|nr:hypothetical protein [Propionibacteriaceae bacterium]